MNDESHFTEGNQGNKDYEVGLNASLSLPPLRSVNAISPTLKRAIIQPSETQKFPRTLVPVNFFCLFCVFRGQISSAPIRYARTGMSPSDWQPGFFDHVLRSDESYAEKWNYVRDNPVRAGLVGSAGHWPYQGEIVMVDRA